MNKIIKLMLAVMIASMSSGCRYFEAEEPLLAEPKGDAATAATFGSGPEQVWVDKAKENFRNGEYGLAERYFRRAVEERYNNAEAWIGLAASYDHLKRFDEADRAYKVVTKMAGNTPSILNNLGYHYMLKGEFETAERTLRAAESQDPKNPYIQNNLSLLANWRVTAGKSG